MLTDYTDNNYIHHVPPIGSEPGLYQPYLQDIYRRTRSLNTTAYTTTRSRSEA